MILDIDLSKDNYRLYRNVWDRFIQNQDDCLKHACSECENQHICDLLNIICTSILEKNNLSAIVKQLTLSLELKVFRDDELKYLGSKQLEKLVKKGEDTEFMKNFIRRISNEAQKELKRRGVL